MPILCTYTFAAKISVRILHTRQKSIFPTTTEKQTTKKQKQKMEMKEEKKKKKTHHPFVLPFKSPLNH